MIRFIKLFFPKTYIKIRKCGISEALSKERKNNKKEREDQQLTLFEYKHKIGSFIIAVPNEYDDMIIGEIVEHVFYNNSAIAIVYDYVRKEKLHLMQRVFPYSESFARTVSDLTPNDRHILFYGTEKHFSSINEDTIIGWDQMKQNLEKNDFFKDFKTKK